MLNVVNGLWRHGRDRGVITATAIRLVLCITIAIAPLLVGVPTQQEPVSVAYFFPMVFGVLGAVTLREHTQWLRPRNRLLCVSRGILTLLADVTCLVAFVVTLEGQPEREGILAGAILAMTVSMLTACLVQELAWLGGAFIGFVCLLAFSGHALILSLPLNGTLLAYGATLIVYSARGPRARL